MGVTTIFIIVILIFLAYDIGFRNYNVANVSCITSDSSSLSACWPQVLNESVLVNNNTFVDVANEPIYEGSLNSYLARVHNHTGVELMEVDVDYELNASGGQIRAIGLLLNNTYVNVSYYYYDESAAEDNGQQQILQVVGIASVVLMLALVGLGVGMIHFVNSKRRK